MGAIRERYDLTDSDTIEQLRDYCGISHMDSDAELQVFAAAAIDLAEQYVNTGLDHLGEDDPLPDAVVLWILTYTAWRYERRDGRTTQRIDGTSVAWEDEPDYALLWPWRTVYI